MAITTTTTLGDTTATVIEHARQTEQFEAVMDGMCDKVMKPLHSGTTHNQPYWGIVTAQALTEGQDMANPQSMADTNVPVTPAEVGCQILLTDKAVRDNNDDVLAAAGRILGDAMAVKHDKDLLAILDSGTTSLGSGTATMSMGHLAAARALLKGLAVTSGGPAPGRYAAVHHPYVWLDIVDVLTPVVAEGAASATSNKTGTQAGFAGEVTENVLRNYTIGRLFGMPCVEDGNLTPASSAAKGGVFATGKGGSILNVVADEWDIEEERDASLRATELNIVGEYGVGVYLAGWIVELSKNAATPA